jgi:DNA-binding beta-propeller fold protein YncE
VDSTHRLVWVSAQCGHSNDPVWAIDADTHKVIHEPVGCGGINGPGIVNPVTGRFYQDSSGPRRLDSKTFTPTPTAFGSVMGVNTESNLMYALGPGNTLQIVDGAPDPEIILTNVPLGFQCAFYPIGIDAVRNRIYIGDGESNQVHVFDGRTGAKQGTIELQRQFADVRAVGGVIYDSARSRLYAIGHGGGSSYLYLVAEGDPQDAIRIPSRASGPVLNTQFKKIYIWAGPDSVD